MTDENAATLTPAIADYVLPVPTRPVGEVVVVANDRDPASSLRRGGEVARALGDHFLALAECQQLFCAELRESLLRFDAAIAEATRAQLKGSVRDALHVLDWVDSVQADLVGMSRKAAGGAEPIDLVDLCSLVAMQGGTLQRHIDVAGVANGPWWGDLAALHETLRLAVALVAERSAGSAAIRIRIEDSGGQASLCVTSSGEPTDGVEALTVERFRASIDRIGARVRPDAMGTGGSGLVIDLPRDGS